jgi:L-threonylcarbamoyladenylate synthase
MNNDIKKAINIIKQGGIIAYPTEAVYGLGCDPFNEKATLRLLKLKQRSIDKGLILISSSWEQIKDLTLPIPEQNLQKILASWPGPITWVFPASKTVPSWIRGAHNSIALRVTNHPIAKAICEHYEKPIVSTSANIEGNTPARTYAEVINQFPEGIDFIIEGEVGELTKPTMIRDALTNTILR